MWEEVVKIVGPSALLIFALTWLTRSVVVHVLTKDVEKFKLELQKAALEHQIRYRRIDHKTADALSQIYGRLHPFIRAVKSYVAEFENPGEPSKEEKRQIAAMTQQEFKKCLLDNRLYLPESLYGRTAALARNLAQIANDFTRGLRREHSSEMGDPWASAVEAIEQDAEPLFSEIVTAFQHYLGVTNE